MAALQKGGYRLSHTRGGHTYLRHPDSERLVVVPVHGNETLPVGTMSSVLRQAELTSDQLADLLDA